jgi:pimeloyl-ACP methyl ester carboxylesterase
MNSENRELYFKAYGAGPPVVVLHGLFGSGENWHPVASALAHDFRVFAVDQRNHGRSFHSERFDYEAMAEDIRSFIDRTILSPAAVIGHSMGGKVAMRLASEHPDRVDRLVVVDITHRSTGMRLVPAVEALLRLDLSRIQRLSEAEQGLRRDIPERQLRLFLLKNLDRNASGAYRWKVNMRSIHRNLSVICGPVEVRRFTKPCLFVRGAESDVIREADWPECRRHFPQAELVTLPGAGHWVHVEAKTRFLETVGDFLAR